MTVPHETPATALPARSRPPRPERLRSRRGAAYLPARASASRSAPLEDELGVQIFVRHGKRVVDLTEPGKAVRRRSPSACWPRTQNLKRAGEEFGNDAARAPSRSRPPTRRRATPCRRSCRRSSGATRGASWSSTQGSPTQIVELVARARRHRHRHRVRSRVPASSCCCPCYQWNRGVIVPPKHPLLQGNAAHAGGDRAHPIVTYDFAFSAARRSQQAPSRRAASSRTWC